MAVKSVLQIDLQDSAFRQFAALYDKYDKLLKGQPAAWKEVQKNIDGSRKSFDELVAKMAAANVQEQLRTKAQERADQLTRTTADKWRDMTRNSREFASNVRQTTLDLLKWGSITTALGGLAGIGSLYGIDRLGAAASANRRSALGLGTTIGAQSAFEANAARLVDPQAFLQSVAGAKFDVNRRTGLLAAGLSQREINADTTQTAVALLDRLKKIADTTNPALYAQVLQARRLDQFAQPTDLERLRNTSPAEYARVRSQIQGQTDKLSIPDDVAQRWQDFTTQMTNAGKTIETVLIKGLVNLSEPLTKLSDAIVLTIKNFSESPTLAKWINDLAKATEQFAGYIKTDEFQSNMQAFVDGIGKMAAALDAISGYATSVGNSGVGRVAKDFATGGFRAGVKALITPDNPVPGSPAEAFKRFIYGQTTENALLGVVRKLEGSSDTAVSPKGAVGRYQITEDTARTYGFDPRRLTDPAYNEQAARTILRDLAKRYHGNTQEILAAYNAGPGAADRFRAAGDNPAVLPRETQKYLQRAPLLDGYAPAVVTIENNTGGNVNASVNGLKNN